MIKITQADYKRYQLPSIVFKAPDNGFIANFFEKRSSFYFSPISVNSFHVHRAMVSI